MMRKFKSLIDQVGGGHKFGGQTTAYEDVEANNMKHVSDMILNTAARKQFINPMAHKEVMDAIPEVYFSNGSDIVLYEMHRLPDNPTQELINEMRKSLMNQLSAVSKKLSEVILQHQPAYYKELQRVRELEEDLQNAHLLCTAERECLDTGSTSAALQLLLNCRKRINLLKLYDALTTIRTLEQTDLKLRDMVEREMYPEAIQLCLECLKVVFTYSHYQCITDLSTKLQDTLELIEEQIDVALSKICANFYPDVYAKLQFSYSLLGKTQTAMDQLLMHFTTCIHNNAFQVVLGFAKLCTDQEEVNLQKKQFDTLCSLVNHDDKSIYIGCLLALCKSLWNVMSSYHQISNWHFKNFKHESENYTLTEFDKKYIEQKLKHGRQRVWLDVQSRVKAFLMGTDLSLYNYDDFILALDIVKRLIQIGEDFVQLDMNLKNSTTLQSLHEPIQKQSLRYFKEHHRRCMEELRMFLENEAWEPCPMKTNFTITQLPEFKFIRQKTNTRKILSPRTEGSDKTKSSLCSEDIGANDNNPFVDFENLEKTGVNGGYNQEEEDSDDETDKYEYGQDEENLDSPKLNKNESLSGPLLTNTALNILRLCGKYMKMCDVLKPISFDVIACMCQLFDYYLYFIYSSFADQSVNFSHKMGVTLQRIESELITNPNAVENENSGKGVKMDKPVCYMLNVNERSNIFGLYQRVMASESLGNLAVEFNALSSHLEEIIPTEKKAFLQQFYSQTINTCTEVRFLIFHIVAKKFINYDSIQQQIGMVKWDINEILSQHSAYVDVLLRELETLQRSMPLVLRNIVLPDEVEKFIWQHCLFLINKIIVEGYSNVKKCSHEGRALMQLDFQQFLGKAEKLTNLKPIPGKEFVESYIKAYYMTEEDLELWIKEHKEYSQTQLTALVNCNASSSGSASKRNKQKLFSLIEDITKRK